MADEDGMEEMNGKIEELVLDNEPYDEDENGIFVFFYPIIFLFNQYRCYCNLLCVQSLYGK